MNQAITPEELRETLANKEEVTILDVRRKADFDADTQMIPGAVYRDPEQVEQWSNELLEGQNVVVYCVRGGSVSKSISEKLQAKKIKGSFVEGGIVAWKESGGEVRGKSEIPPAKPEA
ncbi:MAG: rhodanese-like domain-containing protein [Syntrophobacteraceae bacterium]